MQTQPNTPQPKESKLLFPQPYPKIILAFFLLGGPIGALPLWAWSGILFLYDSADHLSIAEFLFNITIFSIIGGWIYGVIPATLTGVAVSVLKLQKSLKSTIVCSLLGTVLTLAYLILLVWISNDSLTFASFTKSNLQYVIGLTLSGAFAAAILSVFLPRKV